MIDIRKHPDVHHDPVDTIIKCALPACDRQFPYGDGFKINAGLSMAGNRKLPSYTPDCEHVCCSFDHAFKAIGICLREHLDHERHA